MKVNKTVAINKKGWTELYVTTECGKVFTRKVIHRYDYDNEENSTDVYPWNDLTEDLPVE